MTDPLTTPGVPPAADPAAPIAATAETAATESIASPVAPPAVAATPIPVRSDEAAAARTPRVRLRALAGLARLVQLVVMVAIFAAGIALGYARFQAVQPAAPTAGDPVTSGIEAPLSVQGLVQALARNDLEAARSSVPAIRNEQGQVITDPYLLLAGEFRAMQLIEVREVRILSTVVDGPRTATAIIISARTTPGDLNRNLIVQTMNGEIVGFR